MERVALRTCQNKMFGQVLRDHIFFFELGSDPSALQSGKQGICATNADSACWGDTPKPLKYRADVRAEFSKNLKLGKDNLLKFSYF